jgi:hypothetical protein
MGTRTDIEVSNTFSDGTIKSNRDFLGYNIFRSYNGGEFEQINNGLVLETTYTDTVLHMTGPVWDYYITAVYDQCESCPSDTIHPGMIIPEVKEFFAENFVSVYPNPAKDFINIISSENINKITVINFAGQKVFEKKISDENNILLNTARYETGVYILKIETEEGIIAKRVAITR